MSGARRHSHRRMGKTAVRDGSAVPGSPNRVRRSAPFDVHEYTPLEMRWSRVKANSMLYSWRDERNLTYASEAASPTYLWPIFRRGSVHSRNGSNPCACNLEIEADPSLRATAIFTSQSMRVTNSPVGIDVRADHLRRSERPIFAPRVPFLYRPRRREWIQ